MHGPRYDTRRLFIAQQISPEESRAIRECVSVETAVVK